MSREQEDDRKEYVERDPVTTAPSSQVVVQKEPAERVVTTVPAASTSPYEHRESVVHHRTTNTGAIVAIAIGVVVLVAGIALVWSQISFIPWPWSMVTILVVGLLLIGVGASLVSNRAT